jgi:Uncharacterised protein family (UPF0158)
MLKISPETIKEIAEQLDCGMKCFFHLPTGELVTYPDELKWGGEIDEEAWGDDIAKLDENFHEYVAFNAMESHESFGVMEDFIEAITEKHVREEFENIIQRKKPFQQFKYLLPDYPLLREQWFSYKDERYREYVQEQIDDYNKSEKFNSAADE